MSPTLTTLTAPTDTELQRLHDRLAARAESEHLLAVAYRMLDTPIGSLLIAATERGLVRVAFENEDSDAVLAELADHVSPRILRDARRLDLAATELDEYFAHARTTFDLPLDFALTRGFRGEVQAALTAIPYGATATYGEVAALVGRPRAARAVGSACATNPLPIVLPCHRVVPADGTLGRYRGCAPAKATLLSFESA